ncbi:cryptochrome/photolyase family protein [Allomuricauda sp. F6463D]|uniref:cryptochrome/photolyase family protein n=1 Tax=Allomuricauda sp. F6463D TaxID=2926409 RepID=UPI001FF6C1B3|nr:deoxyribodipyrimidine photo-lyase [Muricauda sp. F6463D]MCK0159375.1 DNA photolyase family protein [Muricauda sp. F6463D]
MKDKITLFWFRRDLRLDDNVGLYQALQKNTPVVPIFIFDPEILESLPKNDARVTFIYDQLQKLNNQLSGNYGSGIAQFHDKPEAVFKNLIKEFDIQSVYTNHDYEPYAKERDKKVKDVLKDHKISFNSFKDQVIFEKEEVVKEDGNPYVVYTPYMKRWKSNFNPSIHLVEYDTLPKLDENLYKSKSLPRLSMEDIGFKTSSIQVPDFTISSHFIQKYKDTRGYPAKDKGTSRLGPHLRFGTVSIRKIHKKAVEEKNETFWNELIWREFFMQVLWHFPHTVTGAFRSKYDRIEWRNNEHEFQKWKTGQTGYPLVDAGMRELNQTGFMHNRVRMLVASFLCKHLLIDWRWGEAYFAEKLLDYEMASNVGNWQWAAGSGVDAAPYFRIFNPTTQIKKFDKEYTYINKWVPDLQEPSYPSPMVDHKTARERCLKVYKEAVS